MLSESEIIKSSTPVTDGACVYFLIHGDEVVYVGSTHNICSRALEHMKSDKKFDRINHITVDSDLVLDVEADYIINLNPKYNSRLPDGCSYLPQGTVDRLGLSCNDIELVYEKILATSMNGNHHTRTVRYYKFNGSKNAKYCSNFNLSNRDS